jgi:ribosome-associated translation inhibitor RaiA
MRSPVQITFHGIDASSTLESEVHEHIQALEQLFDRIVRCNVRVELPHKHHRKGRLFHVHIALGVPGREIVVSNDTNDGAHADPYVAVRDAFAAARKQLEHYVTRLRDNARHTTRPVA